jgi:hypothetical protein
MWTFVKRLRRYLRGALVTGETREYSANLPEGFGAKRITMRVAAPPLPGRTVFSFDEHVTDETGAPTDILIALGTGCFVISKDLGRSWKRVNVSGRKRHRFLHAKWIGRSELLLQTSVGKKEGPNKPFVDLLVVNETGRVIVEHPSLGHRWHGCRAVDQSGNTLMYAEYPRNEPVGGKRLSSGRVFRSRDRGRSWQVVFEQSGAQIRHFHFLQARPGYPGEWWLTSGDAPHESHIWVTRDDGDSWADLTAAQPRELVIGGTTYERDAFRLTDLFWLDGEVLWATDDALGTANPPGACVFRSKIGETLAPEFVGRGQWHFRNIIDIGEHLVFLSQRAIRQQGAEQKLRAPGIYLLCKKTRAFTHLFDIDCFPSGARASGFTFSRASRAAKDGRFFTYRSDEDFFTSGQKVLEWEVRLE